MTEEFEGFLDCSDIFDDNGGHYPSVKLDNDYLSYRLDAFDGKRVRIIIEVIN